MDWRLDSVRSSSLSLDCTLDDWGQLDTRRDVVNVRLEMLWNMISAETLAKYHSNNRYLLHTYHIQHGPSGCACVHAREIP